jgi:NADH dehydrogenase
MPEIDVVTGAFGYTGAFIAERLVAGGRTVRTLTRREPGEHRLAGRVEAIPLQFDDQASLIAALRGVDTLYNTYWRRFPSRDLAFRDMIAQSSILIGAAATAGVRRIVHFSVSNASPGAPTSYFRAKAEVERIVWASGLSYAILRPTLLYGPDDILINNLAWTLRRVPIFGVAGSGRYRVQPVLVTDVADLAIRLAAGTQNVTVDGAGPDTFRFIDLVHLVRDRIRARARILPVPPLVALLGARVIGLAVGDVVLTRDEITELTSELLVSAAPATCPTSFGSWLEVGANHVGRAYSSEMARNYRFPKGGPRRR